MTASFHFQYSIANTKKLNHIWKKLVKSWSGLWTIIREKKDLLVLIDQMVFYPHVEDLGKSIDREN